MSSAFDSRIVSTLILALGVSLLSANPSAASPPSQAQGDGQKDSHKATIRQQRFQSLDEAITRANAELNVEHAFGVAALVYTIRVPNDQTVRARTELHYVGKSECGYMPGNVSTGEAVLQPLFMTRATRPVELHIIAPGFQRYVRRVILHTGDLIVWDDVVLEPITEHSAAAVVGRVWLEDEEEDPEGLVIYVDGEPITFTDATGSFVADPVRAGKLLISAYKPGYARMYTNVKVPHGYQQTCELVGYRKRFAQVRWAYQPNGTRSFDGEIRTGTAVLTPDTLSRVSFAKGFKQVRAYSDFLVTQVEDRLVLRHFDVRSGRIPGSMKIKDNTFDELDEAPKSGYRRSPWTLHPGDLYVFHCYDGKHYAMMEVLDITDEPPSGN